MNKAVSIVIGIIIVGSVIGTGIVIFSDPDPELVIYTYDSLLAYPGFDFATAFENYAGLPMDSVEIVYYGDAGSIVNQAIQEKDSPYADILIGIDNILVERVREEQILVPYQPDNSSTIIDGLVEGLASDYLLTPYDYGVISLFYLENRLQGDIDPERRSAIPACCHAARWPVGARFPPLRLLGTIPGQPWLRGFAAAVPRF